MKRFRVESFLVGKWVPTAQRFKTRDLAIAAVKTFEAFDTKEGDIIRYRVIEEFSPMRTNA